MTGRFDGTTFTGLTTAKRFDGSAWVDITTAKRFDGSAWVDLAGMPGSGGGGGGGGFVTPAFLRSLTGGNASGTGTVTSSAWTVTAGALIVVTVGDDSGSTGTVTSVTDSLGNTYTRIDQRAGVSTLSVWWARAASGGTATITVAFNAANGTSCAFVAQQFSGILAAGSPVDVFTGGFESTTSVSSGASPATTQATELVVGCLVVAQAAGVTMTPGTGYSNAASINTVIRTNVAMASKVVTTTGPQTATFTISPAQEWACEVVTFKAAPA